MDGLQTCMSQSALLFFPSDHTQALYHVVSELICKWKRIGDNGRGKKEKEDKRKEKKRCREGETYLLLLKSDQLLLEVINEGSHSFVFSMRFRGHQRGRRE